MADMGHIFLTQTALNALLGNLSFPERIHAEKGKERA